MELVDTHCHLDVSKFDDDRDEVIERARVAGVKAFVVPGIYRAEWPGLLALCRRLPNLYFALGLHPLYLARHQDAHLQDLADWTARERPVAIGEIGLDFFGKGADRDRQLFILDGQLTIAENARLPVLLHIRKAYDELLRVLRNRRLVGGICHAFNGSLQQAHRYLDLGFKLGFGGMLTFQRSTRLRALAASLPDSALVLETDAPDMTVASHRYQRNSPEYLCEIVQSLADVRQVSAEALAEITTRNAREVLRLPG